MEPWALVALVAVVILWCVAYVERDSLESAFRGVLSRRQGKVAILVGVALLMALYCGAHDLGTAETLSQSAVRTWMVISAAIVLVAHYIRKE